MISLNKIMGMLGTFSAHRASRLVLCALLPFQSPLFAGFILSADANFVSQTNHSSNASGVSRDITATGYGIMPSARYEFPVRSMLAVGLGAYAVYGTMSPPLTGGTTSDVITGIGFGGDLWLTLTTGLPIKPFARFMIGRISIEEKVTGSTSVGTFEITAGADALRYNILGGFRLPISTLFELFIQVGFAGVGDQKPTLKSATFNGAAATSTTTSTSNIYTTGYLLGGGVMLKF
jgi:hypothetical protein